MAEHPEDIKSSGMVTPKTWDEFRATGLLWWINRILHTFGWAIVVELGEDGKIQGSFPARVRYRGFDYESETEGFVMLSKHMVDNSSVLLDEAKE